MKRGDLLSVYINPPRNCGLLITMVLWLLLATGGCGVRLIGDYDAIIDQTTTSLQSQIETFLNTMERTAGTPAGEYRNNLGFYDQLQGTLSSLSLRASALPQSQIITEQIQQIQATVADLRQIHQRNGAQGLSTALIDPIRATFIAEFRAVLMLENALKRGPLPVGSPSATPAHQTSTSNCLLSDRLCS